MSDTDTLVGIDGVSKTFTLHLRDGQRMEVVDGLNFSVRRGECVVLGGRSGIGKSSILKMIYGNYRTDGGAIRIRDADGGFIDVATAAPRRVLALRRRVLGYISQFLRVIPRVGAYDIVVAAAMDGGATREAATDRAGHLLSLLNVPERLWRLPPATFSGGEQQRINIARGLAGSHSVLLVDEPTASLDPENREAVVRLIADRKRDGTAVVGVFHDDDVRARVADRVIDLAQFSAVPSRATETIQ